MSVSVRLSLDISGSMALFRPGWLSFSLECPICTSKFSDSLGWQPLYFLPSMRKKIRISNEVLTYSTADYSPALAKWKHDSGKMKIRDVSRKKKSLVYASSFNIFALKWPCVLFSISRVRSEKPLNKNYIGSFGLHIGCTQTTRSSCLLFPVKFINEETKINIRNFFSPTRLALYTANPFSAAAVSSIRVK